MTRTMTTPGGDLIEVVPDDEFCEVHEVNPIDLRIWAPKEPIFAALWFHGEFTSKSGRATQQLHLEARRYGYAAAQSGMNGLLNGSVMTGAIKRSTKGKRTHLIKLVALPEGYVKRLDLVRRRGAAPQAKADEEREPKEFTGGEITVDSPIEVPEPVPGTEGQDRESYVPDVGVDVAEAVAQQLLAQVIAIVTAPPPAPVEVPVADQTELNDARDKLARSLEYSQRLRRELQEASNKLAHMTAERDQLANRIAVAEAQLQRALGTEGRSYVNDEVRRVLAGIMGSAPGTKKGSDDAG